MRGYSRAIASCNVPPLKHEALYHLQKCRAHHLLTLNNTFSDCAAYLAEETMLTLWNGQPLKWRGFPDFPLPASPVHSCRKFSAVCHKRLIQSDTQRALQLNRPACILCYVFCKPEILHGITFGTTSLKSSNTILPAL